MLVDCKVKLAFLQKLQGFMGSVKVWLRVKEPKDHGDGMEGFSETPKSLNKKEMGNILINLTTMKRMKETNQVK